MLALIMKLTINEQSHGKLFCVVVVVGGGVVVVCVCVFTRVIYP